MSEPTDVDGHALWESAWRTLGDQRMQGADSFMIFAVFDEGARPKLTRLTIHGAGPAGGLTQTVIAPREETDQ
jgi:hypothetical protein